MTDIVNVSHARLDAPASAAPFRRPRFRLARPAWWPALWACALALVTLTGCSLLAAPTSPPPLPPAAGVTAHRHMLNEGYSLFYGGALSLADATKPLLFKLETDAFQATVEAVAKYGETLVAELEHWASAHPTLEIRLYPLPEMVRRMRTLRYQQRRRLMSPALGLTGNDFERSLLQWLVQGLNKMRFFAEALVEAEPDPDLRRFMLASQVRLDALYERVTTLLEQVYYVSPA